MKINHCCTKTFTPANYIFDEALKQSVKNLNFCKSDCPFGPTQHDKGY